MKDCDSVLLAAHRGYSGKYPENTLRAFKEAIKLDIDQIETDIRMTADGQLVVIHDADPFRVSGVHGTVSLMTLEEVRKLDAGAFKGEEFAGEKIPTLEEFAGLVRDTDLTFNIELKDYPRDLGETKAKESAYKTIRTLDDYGILDRCMFNSFSADILMYVRSLCPSSPLHTYFPEYVNNDFNEGCYGASAWACIFNKYPKDYAGERKEGSVPPAEWFDKVRSYGMKPCVYFPSETEEIIVDACRLGAMLVTSNTPEFSGEVLDRYGFRKARR